jgi:exodeoxyribonuclease V beta subunit
MTKPVEFNLLRTPIGEGTMLIEASAGTGKTFTIAGLVLRLLVERPDLTIQRILVTTFTDLATAELRGRIRGVLRAGFAGFSSGASGDPLIAGLLEAHPARAAAASRLHDALVDFDEAPIHTIHAFCRRVLADSAFETGALFDTQLVTNQTDLLREVVHDFWRSHFYGGEALSALLAVKNRITPEHLLRRLNEVTRNSLLRVLPERWRPFPEIAAEIEQTLRELGQVWRKEEPAIRRLFLAEHGWAKGIYAKPAEMALVLEQIAVCLCGSKRTIEQIESINCLARSAIDAGVKAGKKPPPRREVFEACEHLLRLEHEFSTAVWAEFFHWARAQLRERKEKQNLFFYDDLLTRVDAALAAPGGTALAQLIREKYGAVLIDEFQDTDPVQYRIFSRIYRGSPGPVAFIGDPKQAIYAFRGADVFTYMEAAAAAGRKFTLTTNRRSESSLVEAVNAIFTHEDPFLLEAIRFEPVLPGPDADKAPLRIGGKLEPPFYLWCAEAVDDLPRHVASKIVRLLDSRATIGEEPLAPRHLAVLTSTNEQATEIQTALRARRIPSVLYSSGNVFRSAEARELRDVLAAVAQPGYEKFVRAALCTDALGCTGNDLDAFTRDEPAWEREFLRFQQHHEIWRERGFIQMLRHLAVEHGVRQRLLAFPDGERRLTNFLHLAELLHAACVQERLGMTGLLKWLGEQMQGTRFAEREEHELRLESDEHAVKIITVHKAKGLQFDVVFCPFAGWFRREPPELFHDPTAQNRLTLDLSDPKAHRAEREREGRAELLRQFYVALTRAKHRCTMIWRPPGRGDDESAPAHLLGGRTEFPPQIRTGPLPCLTEEKWEPPSAPAGDLKARDLTVAIDRDWGVTSFSRLISGRETDPLDEGPLAEPTADEEMSPSGIHGFPKGTRAGTCLHEILEKVDFNNLAGMPEIAAARLQNYGIADYDEIVVDTVRQLAALPLSDGARQFRLSDVPNDSRIAELEFSFPVTSLTMAKLAEVFGVGEMPLRIERLQVQPISGFMNGFIDLVFEDGARFYFADWKSNWLGPASQAYHPAAIRAEMQRNFYLLQLSLYSVALHRYLALRRPGYDFEQHFGGAFYIFLRGIDPAQPGNGVFFQRPARAFVEKLSRIFES